ncbi:50S ribosomal protein L25/general stress protein Ctc [Insolitispirillum peregrinum]|uniref:50S ribosomal protein L25/general stress protein Ctc n=1 Tax=Insolitispirillum peregrinum TaxID=80876 RepID=UPI00361D4FF7
MTEVITFTVQKRDRAGKGAARAIRRQGLVPGVIYGDKQTPVMFAMDPRPLLAALNKPGFYTHQYDVVVDGEAFRCMAQDVQFGVVSDAPIHVDFLRVGKNTVVTTAVPVHFDNQDSCPGLKHGGVLNIVRHEVEVHAKPDDVPEQLVVDLAAAELNDTIHFSAITLPAGVTPVITDRDFTIATIIAPSGLKSDEAQGE